MNPDDTLDPESAARLREWLVCCRQMADAVRPAVQAWADTCRRTGEALTAAINSNPELRAYVESLAARPTTPPRPIPERTDLDAAAREWLARPIVAWSLVGWDSDVRKALADAFTAGAAWGLERAAAVVRDCVKLGLITTPDGWQAYADEDKIEAHIRALIPGGGAAGPEGRP